MFRFLQIAAVAALVVAASSCKHSAPENVAATVNGHVITYQDLDKQLQFSSADKPAAATLPNGVEKTDDDQTTSQKIEVLRVMIDNQIMLQRAEKLGLMATDADVDAKLTELKAPFTQEEFLRQLSARHMTMDDLKVQLRQDLSIEKLVNKEITSKISITDAEIRDFYLANQARFNFPEAQIHMAQIVVTPHPDNNVRNLKNDKAQSDDEARRKIEMLAARIHQGEDFGMLAQNYSEDPNTAPNNGDLGFVPESALERASPDLRKAIADMTPGQVTPVIHTQEGYRILKVISREPAGQREFENPRVQQDIREIIMNRKQQLLRNAYYEVARDEASVTNYLAQAIVQKGQK
ncbi:MAG: peptidylprolyl isomerase [Bryobacteraceae bacterium]|jgi:peptidyl-prolyl cis-trans isomerase SurA